MEKSLFRNSSVCLFRRYVITPQFFHLFQSKIVKKKHNFLCGSWKQTETGWKIIHELHQKQHLYKSVEVYAFAFYSKGESIAITRSSEHQNFKRNGKALACCLTDHIKMMPSDLFRCTYNKKTETL